MYENVIHVYEKLPLATAGIVMGLVLLLLHGIALCKPAAAAKCLHGLHASDLAAQTLLTLDFVWLFLLLYRAKWNALCMPLFDFETFRGPMLIACPIAWFVLVSMVKENLFARALGMFLIMMAIVPMTAAFLKDPVTRLLIPIWWYPVLTIAMFWVGKPYLYRDWMEALAAHPKRFAILNACGAVYALAILACALLFW